MTPGAADLAPLLASAGLPDVGFHQGTVTAWNEVTGTNTVTVNGATLTNLPALNLGEFVILEPGDVVGLLRFKHTYFILGRIILPSGPDNNRATLSFDNASAIETNFGLTTTETSRAAVTLTVPSWADEALVTAIAGCQAVNSRAVVDYLRLDTRIAGVDGGLSLSFPADPGGIGAGTVSSTRLVSSPGATIAVSARVLANGGTWSVNASTGATVSAFALFRRVN